MTKLTPQEQADVTNNILKEWAEEVHQLLLQQLRERTGNVPSSTVRNLTYRLLLSSAGDLSAKFELFFQDSGRHVDMKRLNPGNPLPIDVIIDWVKRKGSGSFSFVPGYDTKGEAGKLSEQDKIQRIAAAIAFAKAKGTIKKGEARRKSQWLNPYFYEYYGKLIGRFFYKQGDYLKEAITNEIKEEFNG